MVHLDKLKVTSEVSKSDVTDQLTDLVAMAAQKQCCSTRRPAVFLRHLAVMFIRPLVPTHLCFVSTQLDSYIHHGDARENHPATDPGHPPGARWTGKEETRTRCKYGSRKCNQMWRPNNAFHYSEVQVIVTCILVIAFWGLAKPTIAAANAGCPSTSASSC